MLLNALASLGHKGIKTLRTFGRAGLMLFNALVGKPEFRKHAPLLVRQQKAVDLITQCYRRPVDADYCGFWRVHRNGVGAARLSGSDHL